LLPQVGDLFELKPYAVAQYNKLKPYAVAQYNKLKPYAVAQYNKLKPYAVAQYNKLKPYAVAQYNKLKPYAVAQYNKFVRTKDRADQYLNFYSVLRKTAKCWRKVVLYLLNCAPFNAFFVYRTLNTNKNSKVQELPARVRKVLDIRSPESK